MSKNTITENEIDIGKLRMILEKLICARCFTLPRPGATTYICKHCPSTYCQNCVSGINSGFAMVTILNKALKTYLILEKVYIMKVLALIGVKSQGNF